MVGRPRLWGQLFFPAVALRLAPRAGFFIPPELTDADKLKAVQEKLDAVDKKIIDIWKSIGTYMGYTVAHYADFYYFKHVLVSRSLHIRVWRSDYIGPCLQRA